MAADAISFNRGSQLRWKLDANRIEMGNDGMVLTFKVNADGSVSNTKKQADTVGWGSTLRVESGGLIIRSADRTMQSAYQVGVKKYYFGR